LTTHHHRDHAGGNLDLVAAFPDLKLTVYGGQDCAGANHIVAHNEIISLGNIKITGLKTPCHTQDSTCYFVEHEGQKAVFTGDTLFNAGCGRFFEGTAEQMDVALNTILGNLPGDTLVYVWLIILEESKTDRVHR
jgi:hydroxyacylglutathione hydrolase